MELLTAHWAFFLSAAIKAAIPVALAALAVPLLARVSAAIRHLVWTLALIASLAAPVLSVALPQWKVLPNWTAQTVAVSIPTALQTDEIQFSEVSDSPRPALGAADGAPAESGTAALDWDWRAGLMGVWAVGAVLLALRLALAVAGLWRAAQLARPVIDPAWANALAETAAHLRIRRRIVLLQSETRSMPMTWGILRPTVMLPAGADGWDGRRRRLVLLHELAHVARWDVASRLVGQLAVAVQWFNPLTWWALRGASAEAERACDDRVLNGGAMATDYAEELLTVASGFAMSRQRELAGIAMARPSRLESRLRAILEPARNRRALTAAGLLAGLAILLIGTPLVAVLAEPAATQPAALPASASSSIPPAAPAAPVPPAAPAQAHSGFTGPQQAQADILKANQKLQDQAKTLQRLDYSAAARQAIDAVEDARQADLAQMDQLGLSLVARNRKIIHPPANDPWKATLSDGTTVELAGVCEHPSLNRPWWQPDGTALAHGPYDHFGGSVDVGNDQLAFEMAVRLAGPSAQDAGLSWEFVPAGARITLTGSTIILNQRPPQENGVWSPRPNIVGGEPTEAGNRLPGLYAVAVTLPADRSAVTMRLGITTGAWHTIAADYHPEIEEDRSAAAGNGEVVFSPANESGDGTEIVAAFTGFSGECSMSAIGADGREHKTTDISVGGTAHLHQAVAKFHGLNLKDIGHFVFQTRSYQWVEFRNVMLRAN